jgi:uncharacterized MAPEG superfamily protein
MTEYKASFAAVSVAALGLFLTKIPVSAAQNRIKGGYDNSHPRIQQSKLRGWGARALGAHIVRNLLFSYVIIPG